MTIADIKSAINAEMNSSITNLLLQVQKEQVAGSTVLAPTDWYSHWDNAFRIRVTMHKDVLLAIKSNPLRGDLVSKKQVVDATATRAAYTRYVVVIPAEVALVC